MLSGYYTAADVPTEAPLLLDDPNGVTMCPLILGGITTYEFRPASDLADVYQERQPDPAIVNMAMRSPLMVKGYWTIGAESEFKEFPPGVYTVAGGDEWGTLTVLHFRVS